MHTLDDVHHQFAECFEDVNIRPFAYLLSKRLQEGHICIPVNSAIADKGEHPYSIGKLPDLKKLSIYVAKAGEKPTPFVVHKDKIYFQRYFNYETKILELIHQKIEKSKREYNNRIALLEQQRNVIESLSADYDTAALEPAEAIDWQLVASIQALLQDFSIITGGPGTGKTTTLAKVLRILFAIDNNARVALAAPTGKAAMRMVESLKKSSALFPAETREKIDQLTPLTIHSLLGYKSDSVAFRHNEENPLPYDWVVVDEASMIDVPLFAKLLSALGEKGRIIFLGDKNQLASVEAGSLLGDLCNASPLNQFSTERAAWINSFIRDDQRKISSDFINADSHLLAGHIIELKLSHRFKSQGTIGNLSKAIIQSDISSLKTILSDSNNPSLVFDNTWSNSVLKDFVEGYRDYIEEEDVLTALKKLNTLRVLVAVREGEKGLYAINRKIESFLTVKGWIKPDRPFYNHRPLIITKNNYELNLFNGDIGIIRPDKNNNLRAWFEDKEKGVRSILPAYLTNAETVFAMTIHKSQGSEFNKVLLVLPEGTDNPLLTRELLYTGVTRSRERVIIQSTEETILHTAATSVKRISGINERLNDYSITG